MTLLRLARLSDAAPPARELLDVADDGAMTGWRSTGRAVGRFGGRVDDLEGLRALVAAVAETDAPAAGPFPLDATVESLTAGEVTLEASANASIEGPWGELLAAARRLLDDGLPGAPVGAVGLVVGEGEAGAVRLEHRGSQPIALELGAAWAEVTRWRDGAPVGTAETTELRAGRVEAGPGWSLDLPLEIPGGEAGDLVTASVELVAEDRGIPVPVVVTGRAGS